MSTAARKFYYRCSECNSKTSTTNEDRAAAQVCVNCRPDLDAAPAKKVAPAKSKTAKPKAAPTPRAKSEAPAPAPTVERVVGTLTDARRAIGPNADFEGFRAEGHTIMYLYEEPAAAPARSFSLAMTKRRLNEPQFQLKFGSLLRKGRMAGTRVIEIPLDPAAPENIEAVDAESTVAPDAIDDTPTADSPAEEAADAAVPAPVAEADSTADTAVNAVPSKRRKPSALDAAAFVLREAGVPMTAKEIWDVIQARDLWASPKGKTPDATIAASMLRESVKLGAGSRFVKAERGKFTANTAIA